MKEESDESRAQKSNALGSGIAIGIAIGTALGVVFDDIAIGVSLGVALGVAFGSLWEQQEKKKHAPPSTKEQT
jgi:phage tail tape-measure protein